MTPRGLWLLPLLCLGCRFDPAGIAVQELPRDIAVAERGAAADMADAAADLGGGEGPPQDLRATDAAADASGDAGGDGAQGVDPLAPFGTPTAVTELSSTAGEDDPTLTGDMLEIYFNRGGDIWSATRAKVTDPWSAPQQVPLLSSGSDETNPELTPDGLTILFASTRSHPQAKGDYDIYVSTRSQRGQPWSTPVPVPSLNTSASDHPAPAPDMLTMVVISDRPGTQGQHDFYLATRASTSVAWGAASPIAAVNTPSQEASAWLDATTLLLYYASSMQGSSHDIYLSTRPAPGQPFGQPVGVASLNTTAGDQDPWLSPDLRTIYFSSDRDGQSDLFVATR